MTFTIKIRSAGGPMLAEYRCRLHGVFELLVDRDANGDPPSSQRCPVAVRISGLSHGGTGEDHGHDGRCGLPSPWTISAPAVHTQFVITASHGRNDPKPHAKSMDTRMLAEGRKNEFRKQRKKIREDDRHKRVKELLR
jgi:hypothetical protein